MRIKKETVKRGILLAVIAAIILVNIASADLVFNSQSNNLVFNTSSLNRMIIDSDGNLLFYNNFTILENLTVGAGTLYVDSSAGRVGIGTSTPSTNLDVRGIGNFSGTVYINNDTDIVSLIGSSAGNAGWTNISGSVYTVQSTDNVGIGTSTPSTNLDVRGLGNFSGTVYINNDTELISLISSSSGNTGWTNTTGNVYTTQLNDKVGIGISSPSSSLHVFSGDVNISNGLGASFFYENATGRVGIGTDTPSVALDVYGRISTNGTEVINDTQGATFDNVKINNGLTVTSGNVGIGISSPTHTLNLGGSANITGSVILGDTTGDTVTFNAVVGTDVLPFDNSKNLGSASNMWSKLYVDEVIANNLSGGNVNGSGTILTDFILDSDNPTDDAEDINLIYELGTPAINAVLKWDSTNKYFDINQDLNQQGNLTARANVTILDSALVDIIYPESSGNIAILGGNLGIGTTAPSANLDVRGIGNFSGTVYINNDTELISLISSSSGNTGWTNTTGNVYTTQSTDNVGIGTTTPSYNLDVRGIGNFSGTVYINNDTDVSTLGGGGGAQWGWSNTTGNVYTTQSSDNVGIGTSSPNARLEVTNDSAQDILFNVSTGDNGLFFNASSGKVGINTADPSTNLDVAGSNVMNGKSLRLRSGDTLTKVMNSNQILLSYNGTTSYTQSIKTRHHDSQDDGNAIDFYVWDFGTDAVDAIGTKHVMTLNAGNVGIGSTRPQAMLEISNTSAISVPWMNITDGVNGTKFIIDAAGNIGVGVEAPLAKLHAGTDVSDYSTYSFANTGALISSVGVDNTAARSNVLTLMRDGTNSVVYAGSAAFDLSRWQSDGVNARSQLDIRLADTTTAALTDVLSMQSNGNVGIGITAPTNTLNVNGTLNVTGAAGLEGLIVDSSGNVGIGTSAPAQLLNVLGATNITGQLILAPGSVSAPSLSFSTDTDTGIYSAGADLLGLATGGSDRIRIDDSGNVGIGTSTPSAKLDIGNAGAGNYGLNVSGLLYVNDSSVGIGTASPATTLDVSGKGTFTGTVAINTGSDPVQFTLKDSSASAPTWALKSATGRFVIGEVGVADYLNVIKKSGNIGIGTSTPSYLLDVNGNVSLNDTLFIDSSSSLVGIGTFSPNALLHIVKDDTINETVSELFLLEHTTSDLSNGTAGIGVALTFRTEDSLANIENISQIQGILKTATDGSEDGELAFLTRSAGGALGERLRIDASGNVGIGTSTPSTNLDVRGLGNFSGTIYINNDTDVSTLGGGGAQWGWSNTTGNVYTTQSSDNVGIGTTTPAYKLEVLDNASISNTLYVTNDSLVGIGNANPNASLEIKDAGEDNDALNVSGVLYVNDSLVRIIATHPDWPIFSLETNTTGSFPDLRVFLSRDDVYFRTAEHLNFETTGDDGTDGASRGVRFKINDNGGFFEVLDDTNMRYFKIDRFGNIGLRSLTSPIYRLQVPDNASFADTLFVTNESTVGIGTSTPANALNVIGDINATGLLYYNGGTQATDFVFDKYFDNNINLNLYPLAKNYSMLPLSELKDFLQTNRHLPGLAGKKLTGQVQAGEINNLLLEKTEEQAIYIVELHDEIKQLKQRLNALENHK